MPTLGLNDLIASRALELSKQNKKAPRVTPDDLEDEIVSETYTLLPNGRTTICQLNLKNGFTVEGKSACVSLANYNEAMGRQIARQNAVNELWPLLGFRLADKLAAQS